MIDFGMNLQEAGDAPRIRHYGSSQPTDEVMKDGGVINLEFDMPNYHNYLVNSWYYAPSERIPARLIFNGITFSSDDHVDS